MISQLFTSLGKPASFSKQKQQVAKRRQAQFALLNPHFQEDPNVLTAPLSQLHKYPDCASTFAIRAYKYQHLNAIADIDIERCLARPGTIPFSVKNQLKVKGMVQTCGYSVDYTQEHMATQNSAVVDILQQQGMTAYIQSNVPQGLWGIESNNYLFGLSRNPYNQKFTSGGSSGGEAALVRMACSAFGVGSDMAGSVRIPASFCGVCSFKPTGSRRLSRRGRLSITGSQIQIVKDVDASLGFMTRCVDDLQFLLSLTLGKKTPKDWLVNGQWSKKTYEQGLGRKLRIGYMMETRQVSTAPAIKNVIRETLQQLSLQGHEIIEFQFQDLPLFRDNINKINATPGIFKTILGKLQGEQVVENNRKAVFLQSLGNKALSLASWFTREYDKKKIYQNMKSLTTMEYFKVIAQNQILKDRFMDEWERNGLDILITPVTPFTALLAGHSKYLVQQLSFCSFQNILEMPAGVVPIRLTEGLETFYNDTRFYGLQMSASVWESAGLPVCIQVTSKPHQDELCLATMKSIQRLMGKIPAPKI